MSALIGRQRESEWVRACLSAQRNVLLEGPVGVGKTRLALSIVEELKRPVFRVDGDSRYSEQKLSGWFDPPAVLKRGYGVRSFVDGPLTAAMKQGGVLFINELNRLPEGVQNVLLPAIDERVIAIPRLGTVRAKPSFLVIATQNPKEFVATSHLSEAILDRFELILLDYQSREEERAIVSSQIQAPAKSKKSAGFSSETERLIDASVDLARLTRDHPRIKRGASIRAALSIAEIAKSLLSRGQPLEEAFTQAVFMALPTRIEFERDSESDLGLEAERKALLRELALAALQGDPAASKKKI